MRGRKTALTIVLMPSDRAEIEHWQRATTGPAGLARRGRALLLLEQGTTLKDTAAHCGLSVRHVRKWADRYRRQGLAGLRDKPRPGRKPVFPPAVALHLITMACEHPDEPNRSLSLWDCRELARPLVAEGVVPSIAAETVRRILEHHHLKPWRQHLGLSPQVPRDAAFAAAVPEICVLSTWPLREEERVLCVDEKTSLQPRPRTTPTLAAQPERPVRVEHASGRCGALSRFAAFDTRTGRVYGRTAERKRQAEFIAFLEQLDQEIPAKIKTIHVIWDNLRMHKGKQVQAWLAQHPRFVFHHPPVHCSWMNQVEQWFSILQRKRLRIADFVDRAALAERLQAFIAEWNQVAHPFNWCTESVAKVMAKCELIEVPSEEKSQLMAA